MLEQGFWTNGYKKPHDQIRFRSGQPSRCSRGICEKSSSSKVGNYEKKASEGTGEPGENASSAGRRHWPTKDRGVGQNLMWQILVASHSRSIFARNPTFPRLSSFESRSFPIRTQSQVKIACSKRNQRQFLPLKTIYYMFLSLDPL